MVTLWFYLFTKIKSVTHKLSSNWDETYPKIKNQAAKKCFWIHFIYFINSIKWEYYYSLLLQQILKCSRTKYFYFLIIQLNILPCDCNEFILLIYLRHEKYYYILKIVFSILFHLFLTITFDILYILFKIEKDIKISHKTKLKCLKHDLQKVTILYTCIECFIAL